MIKGYYQNRIGMFPIFWGSRRKERDIFYLTSQVETPDKKKKPPLFQVHRYPLHRSFSVSSGEDKKDHRSIKEKKTASHHRETKNNLSQGNGKKSSLFGFEKIISQVVKKEAHNRQIQDGNVEKKWQGNWSKKKKGVSDKKEININDFPRDREESSVDFKVIGVEKAAHDKNIKDESVKKKKASTLNSDNVGVEKAAQKRRIKGGNVQKKKDDFRSREKKPAYQKLSQAESLEESKKLIRQSHLKDQNLQRKDKKFHNGPDHQKQIKVSNLKRNKKITQVERCFAIQQRLYSQTHPVVAASPSKKSIKSRYIATVNNWLGGKAKLSDNIQSKGIKILHKNSPKNIKLQQMMHKRLLKAKPVMHKSPPKGKVLYPLSHQKSKREASHQASPKDIINRWLSLEVKLADKIKTKDHKRSNESSPASKGLHGVTDKNLTNKSNLQGRTHRPYFRLLLQGTPQTSSNYRMIGKVNKMWCVAEKIVRKTEKLLQQQNKKIQDLEVKLVKFYDGDGKEIAKATDCEIKFIDKFRNMLMRDGKKSKARTTLFKSLKLFRTYLESMSVHEEFIQKLAETESSNYTVHCLQQAVDNIKPSLEVRRKKISGILRQIPAVPSEKRQRSVSIRWIIESAKKRKKKSSKPFFQCLAEEFLDAYKNQGEPYKKKQALHDTAEASRIYIRYRWW